MQNDLAVLRCDSDEFGCVIQCFANIKCYEGELVSFGRFCNYSIACEVLFHRLTLVAAITFLIILSWIFWLLIPISVFEGLISLQDALFMKTGLWPLML